MFGFEALRNPAFEHDHAILKSYNPTCSKVVMMRSCRMPGFETPLGPPVKRNAAGHDAKLRQSLSRTRTRIFELAICNPWEHFVTLTLSPKNGNRQDLKAFKSSLSKWLNNLNYRKGYSIKYLLIPELHSDGVTWHMHGFFMGLPEEVLRPFSLEEHLPYKVRSLLREGHQLFDWPGYAKKFGYVTCERIQDMERCSRYVTKYITKELAECAALLNQKLYLCSQGLNRAEVVCRGPLMHEFDPDFCNDYVAIKQFPAVEEALELFVDSNEFDLCPVGFSIVAARYTGGASHWKVPQ